MSTKLDLAPHCFDKNIHFGRFAGLVKDHDLSLWDKELGRRRFQRKAWVFGGVFCSEASVGFAIADVGYAASAFCYYFNMKEGVFIEEKALVPFYFPKNFKASLSNIWHLKTSNREWFVETRVDGWNLKFQGKRLHLSLYLQHKFPGISAIAPSEGRPFHYTYKLASIPANIELSIQSGPKKTLNGNCGVLDYSLGFPARVVFWNWACLVGRSQDGSSIGINVAGPFNDGLENALWCDGHLVPLSIVSFAYDKANLEKPWYIQNKDASLNLEFYPEAKHSRNQNIIVLKSNFQHALGHFVGTWKGKRISGRGAVEEHTAVW